jgi:Flp pilus assembly pilin Flp
MKEITNQIKVFFADDKGAETVEWVMIAAVLAGIIVVAFWTTLQGGVNGAITNITGSMSSVLP